VTVPTPAMREAMASAEVGDDVYGEDPTINRLQEIAAAKVGMEDAVFVSSGTQGNLIALLVHCQRGDEVILGDKSHIYNAEAGGSATVGGIHPRPLMSYPDGTLNLDDICNAIRPDNEHYPITRLIAIENTHAVMYGSVLPVDYVKQVAHIARGHGLKLHIDGARIFNAAVAKHVDVTAYTQHADSISFCLSKGLSAPVGSMLCGSKTFIANAKRKRKLLGSGMRQAGIIAAAAIIALEQMIDRLAEDHENAKRLSEGINRIPFLKANVPQSNIVYIDIDPSAPFDSQKLAQLANHQRVKVGAWSARRIRCVTHCYINSAEVDTTVQVLQAGVAALS
jgi:threonine aldolase